MKIMKKIKNCILYTITALTAVFILLFILSMDSQTTNQLLIGGMISCICGMWLALFGYANIEEE